MTKTSGIEWTGETWDPIEGCTAVSPGCAGCWAARMTARMHRMQSAQGRSDRYAGLTPYPLPWGGPR